MKSTTTLDITRYPNLEAKWLEITPVNLTNIESLQKTMIQAYKSVFNASAWREWKKCSKGCGNKWTFEEAPETCCGIETIDFYSDAEVSEAVQKVLQKTYSQCLALLDSEKKAVWFTWWWSDSLAGINQEKLKLNNEQYRELIKNLWEITDNPENTTWYYQSETGIISEYREGWIGRSLVASNEILLQENQEKAPYIIQRTSRKSPMFNIRKELGYEVVFDYNDEDERVLFAKKNTIS